MHRIVALCLALSLSLVSTPAEAVPDTMNHQGRLFDALGAALTGPHTLDFAIYDTASGGSAVWTQNQTVPFDNGYFVATLGGMDPAAFTGGDFWLGLAVDGGPELPNRVQLSSVPYAFHAANLASGATIDASEVMVNGTTVIDTGGNIDWSTLSGLPAGLDDGDGDTLAGLGCTDNQVALFSSGSWGCENENAHGHAGEDITSGTVPVSALPVGVSSGTVAAGDHTHAGPTATSCPPGEALVGFNSADFSAICAVVGGSTKRVFSRQPLGPQIGFNNQSAQPYPDLELNFDLDDDSQVFIVSSGTIRNGGGLCHALEDLIVDGQVVYRPYPYVNHSRSHWQPRMAFWGIGLEGGSHNVRMLIGDNHDNGTCAWQGDSQPYGYSRIGALAFPGSTPMGATNSQSDTALSPSWGDKYADLTLNVSEDSDIVMFNATSFHGNNHHTAGEA